MLPQLATIDRAGRVVLPKSVLDALGTRPGEKVTVRLIDGGVVIEPRRAAVSITKRIAAMNLPVADWETMEQEIEAGRLCQ